MKPYLVHMTDLFHPHEDPDDHYDLAVVFALHKLGFLELGRVIIDYPPDHVAGDPALCAAAQLNEITGSSVPVCAASSDPEKQARAVAELLRKADRPVSFTVVGSTAHIAGAIRLEPELFAEKCGGIYLAAGTGAETPGGALEYNVNLHPEAYVTVMNAPCPVYWAPCFHTILPGNRSDCLRGGEYGSVYCIQQKELLEELPNALQNYFLYMFTRSADPRYLRYLKQPADRQTLAVFGENIRRLWSTPLFFRAAGIPCESFEFLPVKVRCTPDGRTSWEPREESDRYVFHLKNRDRQTDDSFDRTGSYKEEMLAKMKELFRQL